MGKLEAYKAISKLDGNFYAMAGPHNKLSRQKIYTALTGKQQTKANSGVNNIINFLMNEAQIPKNCTAVMFQDLKKYIDNQIK